LWCRVKNVWLTRVVLYAKVDIVPKKSLLTPRQIFIKTVRTQKTKEGFTLLEAGIKKARWFRLEPILNEIRTNPDLFCGDNRDDKLQDSVFLHQAIWGRDANVLLHNQIIARRASSIEDIMNCEELRNLQIGCYLHDLCECHLESVCDVVTGQKTQDEKDFENETTQIILQQAGLGDSVENIMSIIKKKGKLGKILKSLEHDQFYATAIATQKRLQKLESLRYKNINGIYTPVPERLQEFWIDFSTPIINSAIDFESERGTHVAND
jgi:hypothetical protein